MIVMIMCFFIVFIVCLEVDGWCGVGFDWAWGWDIERMNGMNF